MYYLQCCLLLLLLPLPLHMGMLGLGVSSGGHESGVWGWHQAWGYSTVVFCVGLGWVGGVGVVKLVGLPGRWQLGSAGGGVVGWLLLLLWGGDGGGHGAACVWVVRKLRSRLGGVGGHRACEQAASSPTVRLAVVGVLLQPRGPFPKQPGPSAC